MASSSNRGRRPPPEEEEEEEEEEWTPEMRDRQARGKDPNKEDICVPNPPDKEEEEEESDEIKPLKIGGRHHEETHWERERKGEAMSVLDNPEALLAHAQANGDSVTGQRVRFQRQLCGYDEDDDRMRMHAMRSSKAQQQQQQQQQQYAGERRAR